MTHDPPDTPFDDFPREAPKRRLHLASFATLLRVLSAIAMLFALACAIGIILLDAAHLLNHALTWHIKSALPLIGIGISYALLVFTLPRTITEFCLGLMVSLGFTLWGIEQFIPNPHYASLIDDLVVLLFILDLSIVIRAKLRRPS
jgi:hypothetical protein